MSIDSVVSIFRTNFAAAEAGPALPDIAAGQTLEGVVLAIGGPQGVTIGLGSYRLKADIEGRFNVGDRVKVVVAEAGPPPQLKLLSVVSSSGEPAPAGEALLPLMGRSELSAQLYAEVRRILTRSGARSGARSGETMPEAKELAAMLEPIPLDAPAGQLSAALAQQIAQSGMFLEGKLRRGLAGSDVKALTLRLLERLTHDPNADAAAIRILRELAGSIETQQARDVLSLKDASHITIPIPVLIGDRETEVVLRFRFDGGHEDGQSGPTHVSFSIDLLALRRLRVDFALAHSRELALDFCAEDEAIAATIERHAEPLRDALTRAGFRVTRIAARAGKTAIEEPARQGDAETPPAPLLINERA